MNTRTKDYNFTAVDFETANFRRGSACAIGLVRVEDGVIVDEYYSLLKPDPFEFNYINTGIHGIKADDCANAKSFNQIWEDIRPWLDDQIVVAHQYHFEKSVFRELFSSYNISCSIKNYLCTCRFSEAFFYQEKSFQLPHLCYSLFGKVIDHHHALEDARACAEVAIALIDKKEPPTLPGFVYHFWDKPTSSADRKEELKYATLTKETGYEEFETLKGLNFTFTGDLTAFSKDDAAQFVVNFGGKAGNNVTTATTHLVVGGYDKNYTTDHVSGKHKKALDFNSKGRNIIIWTRDEFLDLVSRCETKKL